MKTFTEYLNAWPASARVLFFELHEDAPSAMQRELLARAVCAGRTAAEIHSFADQIRDLTDAQVFDRCTLANTQWWARSLKPEEVLAAEADPVRAFVLNGGVIEAATPVFSAPIPRTARPQRFEADSIDARPQITRVASAPTERRSFGAVLNRATEGLGLSWQEHDIDTPNGMPVKQALSAVASALRRSIPVPISTGKAPGHHARHGVILQMSEAANKRAYQLYDVRSLELAWVNELDFLSGKELPLEAGESRRLTRIAVPA